MSLFPLLAPLQDLFIFRLKHDLAQPDNTTGLLFGLATLGGILGGLLASLLRRRLGFGISWLGAIALIGMSIIGIGLTANTWLMAFLATGFPFGQVLLDTNSIALRQQLTPDHLLGRVTAASWTIYRLLCPIGVTVFTALVAKIGTPSVLTSIGVIALAIAVAGTFTSARMPHPELPGSVEQRTDSE